MKKCKKIRYKPSKSSKVDKKPDKKRVVRFGNRNLVAESEGSLDDWKYNAGESLDQVPLPNPVTEKTALQRVKDWLSNQRFIPQDLTDDFFNVFLSGSNFDVTGATELLKKYFYSRQEPSYLFRGRDPTSPENLKIFKNLYVMPMPGITGDGRKVIITGIIEPTARYDQLEHAKYLAMVIDLLIWGGDFGDFVVVFEGTGFRIPQLWENKVPNHKTITSLLMDTIPVTLKAFYFLFPPPHVTYSVDSRHGIWMTVVRRRQDMVKLLSGVMLPYEYGGNFGYLKNLIENWNEHLITNKEFYVSFEKTMINDYRRRMCFEKERTEGGKNWVQNMKLEADEWEYKVRYYERMKHFQPLRHKGFGKQRVKTTTRAKPAKDPMEACRKMAKLEADRGLDLTPTTLYNGFAKQMRQEKLKAEAEAREAAEKAIFAKLLFCQDSVPYLQVCFF